MYILKYILNQLFLYNLILLKYNSYTCNVNIITLTGFIGDSTIVLHNLNLKYNLIHIYGRHSVQIA